MRWNIDPILVELGPITLRWYGLFFALGLILAARSYPRIFQDRGLPVKHAERLTLWLPIGMIIGAHLVHLIFYEPRSFIDNPRRILEIGSGLASHGGGLGATIAVYAYCRKHKLEFLRYLDAALIGAIWVFPLVRLGNFFNSEIVGLPTDVPWGVIFERRGFESPRHPSQLYEAIAGTGLLGVAYWVHGRFRHTWRSGTTFFVLIAVYFSYRFLLEYFKEFQVLSPNFPFTMGQLLSLPMLLVSLWALFFSKRFRMVGPAPGAGSTGAGEPPAAAGSAVVGGQAGTDPGGTGTGAGTRNVTKKARRKVKGRR